MASGSGNVDKVESGESSGSSLARVLSMIPDTYGMSGYSKNESESNGSVETLQIQQEWNQMLDNWAETIKNNGEKLKESCRQGIPSKMRSRAWFYLSGGYSLLQKNPNLYEELVETTGSPTYTMKIVADLHLKYSDHRWFAEYTPGRQKLYSVLKAYSIYKREYCRAQGPVVALLLMQMPALQSFWSFVAISKNNLSDYKDKGREMLREDGKLLDYLLSQVSPIAHDHLTKVKIDPRMYIDEWFLSLYTLTLPEESVYRVWDMLLCEGRAVMFKVALALIKGCLGSTSLTKNYPTRFQTLELLKQPPHDVVEEEALVREVQEIDTSNQIFRYEIFKRSDKRSSDEDSPTHSKKQKL